jgi:uncharacterized protein (UPF0303 family)
LDTSDHLAHIDAEERHAALRRFDNDDAWWLASRLRDIGLERQAPLAIDIRRAGCRLINLVLAGATADSLAWTDRKIAVTMRFERSSYAVGLMLKKREGLFEAFGLDRATHAVSGGAVPIRLDGTGVIGAVAISGLSQEDDHRLAVEGLLALQRHQGTG